MARYANILGALVVLAALAAAGCGGPKGSPINHFVDSPSQLARIGSVVLIELAPDKSDSGTAAGMTEALYKALQARGLFQVRVIPLTHPACRDLPLSKEQAFTMADLDLMRSELKCDVVIFGAIRHFETYPRMQIGLNLQMLNLSGGRLGWKVDHTWDTTDKAVQKRIKEFFAEHMRDGYDPVGWRLATMSPRTFQKFVAYETVNTLPTRQELAEAPKLPRIDTVSTDKPADFSRRDRKNGKRR